MHLARTAYRHATAPLACLLLLALSLLPVLAQAGEVSVKEVSLSLYNKPVTGYRLVIDRGQATVGQHILQHVALYDSHKPFQYEQTIIYENIVYSPVTSGREITLYYLLRNLQDHYTELTVVAMYDYKRSVCMREFPDLAERLVADIAVLVRQTSGDIVRMGEVVYDDATLTRVAANAPPPVKADAKGGGTLPPVASEARNEQVLVQQDPFRPQETVALPTQDSVQRMLIAQRRMLEEKEEELRIKEQALEEDRRRYQANQNALAEVKVLRDSVERMNRRILNLIRAEYSGDASTSSDGSEKLLRTQEQLSRVSAEKGTLATRYDSLSAAHKTAKADLATTQRQRDEYKDKWQAEQLRAGQQPGDAALRTENEQLRRDLTAARDQKATLERQLATAGGSTALRDSIRLLTSRITLLERTAGDNGAQQETISRQQAQLQAKEQQIKALEQKQAANRSELEAAGTRVATLEGQLRQSQEDYRTLLAKGSTTASQLETYQQQMKALNRDLTEVAKKVEDLEARSKADADSLAHLRATLKDQQRSTAERDRLLRQSRQVMDSLSTSLQQSSNDNARLRTEQKALQSRVDSLAILTASPTEQQNFVREQWKKLQDWEAKLNERDLSLQDQEKLAGQREAYLKRREQELAQQELRYQNLLERENRIKLRETQLGLPSDNSIPPPSGGALPAASTGPRISAKAETMDGGALPVYAFTLPKTYGEAQKQAVGFMVSQGKYHDSMVPELTYFNTLLPEVSPEPLEVRIRLSAAGSGTAVRVSYRLAGGAYIGDAATPELSARALAFTEKMANWK